MSRWFRHYAGMMRDEKLVRAAMRSNQPVERVVWVWGAILESAAEINDGGRYDLEPAEAAYFLRSSSDDILAIIDALSSLERLAGGRVAKWGDRQFQSDSSAARQGRYRDRQKVHADAPSGGSDGEVTAADRHADVELTPPDTDTDTDGLLPQSLERTPAKPKKRATQIPDDFQPNEAVLSDHQIDNLTPDEVSRQVERMIDWAKSKGEARKDWNAFARGWLRKEADQKREREAKRTAANGYNTRDSITQAFDYIDRRDARRGQDGSQENPQLLPGLRQASA